MFGLGLGLCLGLRPENAGLGLGLGLETSGLSLGLGLEASGLGLGLVPPGLVNITVNSLIAIFQYNPSKLIPECLHSGFYWS